MRGHGYDQPDAVERHEHERGESLTPLAATPVVDADDNEADEERDLNDLVDSHSREDTRHALQLQGSARHGGPCSAGSRVV